MKDQQNILAGAAVKAAKLATEKAATDLRAEVSVALEGLKGAFAARHDAIERELTAEINKSRDDVVARFNDSEHRVDVKTKALQESQQIHADFIENLRQQSAAHDKQIVDLIDSLASANHQVRDDLDRAVEAIERDTKSLIDDAIELNVKGAESRLSRERDVSVNRAREDMTALIESKRAGLLEELTKQAADLGASLGALQSEFETSARASFSESEQKLQDRVERETNDLVLTIEARLEGAEEKRDKMDQETRRIAEEFAVLNESVVQSLLDASRKRDEAHGELRAEVDAWVKQQVTEVQESLETTANLLLHETRAARDQIVDDVFDTAKEYVESLKIPDPIPGEKGDRGPIGEKGEAGRDGAVASVSYWKRDEYYSKDTAVSHFAGLWVATCNTDTEPGKSDAWINVAGGVEAPVLDDEGVLSLRMSDGRILEVGKIRGPEGRSWQHQGTYNPDGWYTRADVVVLRGTSYVAVDDSPGSCPGSGWRMVAQAQKGATGKPGKQGKAGDPGLPGPVGPPGISIKWRGAFELGQTYRLNDACSYNGGVWIALQETTELPKADGVNWDPMIRGQSSRGGGGNVASASGSMTLVTLTQAEYDALSPPLDNHLYLVCG